MKKLTKFPFPPRPPGFLGYVPSWQDKIRWVIQDLALYIPYPIRDFYHKHIRTVWRPQHSRIRKAIPKYWMDLDHVLQDVCFEIIKSFYEDEYKANTVDWEGTGGDALKFVKWLEEAYVYITSYRKVLEKQIDNAYPNYEKVSKLEEELEKHDTKILIELIKWRRHMWT